MACRPIVGLIVAVARDGKAMLAGAPSATPSPRTRAERKVKMEFGLFTEFQCPAGMSEATAFEESMAQMRAAEELGFDAVWLGELHFQKDRSVLASPLVVAAAIAAGTRRVKIGIAVQVLPLSHPLRVAEDVATVDHLSGGLGYPLFVAVRTSSISDLRRFLGDYHEAWLAAGHPGRGNVALLVPVYVAETARQAREEPEASTMHWFRSIAEALKQSPSRRPEAERLATISYDEILAEQVVYGTPEAVAEGLSKLRAKLGFSSLSVWMNVGAQIPHQHVLTSMRLFSERVKPRLA